MCYSYLIVKYIFREVNKVNTIAFSEIRESFTAVAQTVQFGKESVLVTRNNKPAIAVVPVELLLLVSEIVEKAAVSKDIAEITDKYMLLLKPEDIDYIKNVLSSPPKANKHMLASIKAAKNKFTE